jgi:hypothetical protein
MTRVNRPDTLLTQLREIERRLRLLEGRRATASALTSVAARSVPVSFAPARPQDWPATDSPEWTDLVLTLAQPGEFRVVVDAVADRGTAGQTRVTVNGTPVSDEVTVGEWRTVDIAVTDELSEVVVQARRTEGDGLVRVSALLV